MLNNSEPMKFLKSKKEVEINGEDIDPMVTWGTSPQDVVSITEHVPDPEKEKDEDKKAGDEPEVEPEFLVMSNPCRVLKA